MTATSDRFQDSGLALHLEARRISWDSELLGCPVAEIIAISADELSGAQKAFDRFLAWIQQYNYGMVSCRLPDDKLIESALLERNRFRFIEMVLHPELVSLEKFDLRGNGLEVSEVGSDDMSSISRIAESAFAFERFHVDPFLNSRIANARYRRWVESITGKEAQRLLKATQDGHVIGFFLVEYISDLAYWHLTAIAPELKGRGLGVRVWKSMIKRNKDDGMNRILTTISARNIPVLNLYSKLNFRFQRPDITFHWVKKKF